MAISATIWSGISRAEPPLSPPQFRDLAEQCAPGVAAETLAAIAVTETALDRLAIHDNTAGTSLTAATKAEAIAAASRLLDAGHSLDLGLMQINSSNLERLGLTTETAFDACRSIAAGAEVLRAGYEGGTTHAAEQAALRVAISRYNTGDAERGFANGYVARVEQSARTIVPALDPATPAPGTALGPRPFPNPVIARTDALPIGWEVWPRDSETAGSGGSPSSPPSGVETAILADAGAGETAPVVTYPRRTEAGNP